MGTPRGCGRCGPASDTTSPVAGCPTSPLEGEGERAVRRILVVLLVGVGVAVGVASWVAWPDDWTPYLERVASLDLGHTAALGHLVGDQVHEPEQHLVYTVTS